MMSNPLYSALNGGGNANMMQMLQQLRSNPVQFLANRRINVPQNMTNDPNAIINHLLSTGRFNQEQVNRAYQIAQSFRK